ncbi:hypothetical protein ULMS_24300 [Patiriisocius marinistellae]|uniref:Deacylase n=1 Tax=Patiriisocius marinistellae TaxID=2494560 RepID=A0A5J4G060_9FLAO|nr:acyloxyacyl hydrolase [Patiriisocius marinistellae]GEQ86922.1 hypothetical protein ULMS_24300 [Patiriisocius marinistellae]
MMRWGFASYFQYNYSLSVLLFFVFLSVNAQDLENEKLPSFYNIQVDYYYGNILEHNPDLSHLIQGHPTGVLASFNRKSYGAKNWERFYNYPDIGVTFGYQDTHNPILGKQLSLNGHFSFYFLKRNLQLTAGQGLAYITNPYDFNNNPYNNAYGSRFTTSMFFKLGYVKENIWNGFGFQTGLFFMHYSNGNFKAPNTSTNTIGINVGVKYNFNHENFPAYISLQDGESTKDFSERIKYNIMFRAGINQSDVIGSPRYPFFVISGFADRRLNYKSTLQMGVDIFFMKYLKKYIAYRAVAFPEDGYSGDEDYKRVGLFVGHELRFSKTAFVTQLGYYVYFPFDNGNRIYNRLGINRYLFNDKYFAGISVKSHWAKAEAIEFSVGARL